MQVVPVAWGNIPVAWGNIPVTRGNVPVAWGNVPVAWGNVPVARIRVKLSGKFVNKFDCISSISSYIVRTIFQ
jgi:hypothetical protein